MKGLIVRRMIATAVGVVALAFAGAAPVAAGPLDSLSGGDRDEAKLTIEAEGECSAITVTWTNNTNYEFLGDYRVDGEAPVNTDNFGELWTEVRVPAGESVTEQIDFYEDSGDHEVQARWARGPESDWYDWDDWTTTQVGSDCDPAAPTATQPTCEAPTGSITIPEQERHSYTIDGKAATAGEHEAGTGDHLVEAFVPESADAVRTWTLTVGEKPDPDECDPTDEPTAEPDDEPTDDCAAYPNSGEWCDDGHGDYDCADIDDAHKPIKVADPAEDPFGLDGDSDGLGCEVPDGDSGDDTGSGDVGDTGTAHGDDSRTGELPDTGASTNMALGAAAALAVLAGLTLVVARRQSLGAG